MIFSSPCLSEALCSSAFPFFTSVRFAMPLLWTTYVRLPGRNLCQAFIAGNVTFVPMPHRYIHIRVQSINENFSVTIQDVHLAIVLLLWEFFFSCVYSAMMRIALVLSRFWCVFNHTYGNNIIDRFTVCFLSGNLLASMLSYLWVHARYSHLVIVLPVWGILFFFSRSIWILSYTCVINCW